MTQAIIIDAHGRVVEHTTVVPPGGTLRVPLRFADHLSPEARRAIQALQDQANTDAQGFESGHRPGHGTGTVDHKAGDAARQKYLDHLTSAWKQPPANAKNLDPDRRSDGNPHADDLDSQ